MDGASTKRVSDSGRRLKKWKRTLVSAAARAPDPLVLPTCGTGVKTCRTALKANIVDILPPDKSLGMYENNLALSHTNTFTFIQSVFTIKVYF